MGKGRNSVLQNRAFRSEIWSKAVEGLIILNLVYYFPPIFIIWKENLSPRAFSNVHLPIAPSEKRNMKIGTIANLNFLSPNYSKFAVECK